MPVWPHDDVRKHSEPKRHQKQIIINLMTLLFTRELHYQYLL